MKPLAVLPLLVAASAAQDDAVEARIGLVDAHRPIGTTSVVFPAPTLDRCVVSYRFRDKTSFVLENGREQATPVRFLGWKMPERKSVLLAWASEQGASRKLLVGGEELAGAGDVWDALLLKEGVQLAVVVRTPSGMVLEGTGAPKGPFESIDFFGRVQDLPCYVTHLRGESRLHVGDREFPLEGIPIQVAASAGASRVAWVELHPDKRQRPVLEGKPGPFCDSVASLHFSPNGEHVAVVTRHEKRYRGWVDGREIPSDHSVTAARAFNDGTPVGVEMWVDASAAPSADPSAPRPTRGRLIVGGRREERVLPQAVSTLEYQGERLWGVARTEAQSVLFRVEPSGEVAYTEVRGRVGHLLPAREGEGLAYSIETAQGTFVQAGGRRAGPFDSASDLFFLEHGRKFGYVAHKGNRVQLVAGEKTYPLALGEVVSPPRISKTELTAAVVGVLVRGARKEVWVRVVPLD